MKSGTPKKVVLKLAAFCIGVIVCGYGTVHSAQAAANDKVGEDTQLKHDDLNRDGQFGHGNHPATHERSEHLGHTIHSRYVGSDALVTGTSIDFFTNNGLYLPRINALRSASGEPDWPWLIVLVGLSVTVMAGCIRIFWFWRQSYLAEVEEDRNKKMMQMAHVFLWCAICGYGMTLLMYVWPAYRLLALFLFVLNIFTWKFAWHISDFKVSLSAVRLQRELSDSLKDQAASLEREVAKRTQELEQTREESKRLALVAAHTNNAVVITDIEGRIEWVNAGFERISGHTFEEVKGKTPGSILQGPDTDPETVARVRQAIKERRAIREDILNYHKNGESYWLSMEIQPVFDEQGEVSHFMAIEMDITELRQQQLELQKAKEEADLASLSKSQFLANMSHEIRTPMTAILGYTDLLINDLKNNAEAADDAVRTIQSNASHLLTVVNDILDMSKIEAGQMGVELIKTNPLQIASEVITLVSPRAKEKSIDCRVQFDTRIPVHIQSDPTRLRQILLNLMGNALKFTQKGSAHIHLACDPKAETMQFRVIDTGIGMTSEQCASIAKFEAFNQADTSTTRKFGGTGLGLRISNALAKMLGGKIEISSLYNVGSEFTVTVKTGSLEQVEFVDCEQDINQLGDQEKQTGRVKPVDAQVKPLQDVKILLAEDGPDNQKLIRFHLKKAGAEVTVCDNGRIAVDTIKQAAEDELPDVVLMDMQMPELDGYGATRELRESGFDIPIVALTAHAMEGDRQKCLDAGCNDYLTKPIDKKRLVECCRSWLVQSVV